MSRIKGAFALAAIALSGFAVAKLDATSDFKKFLDAEGPKVMKAFKNKDISYFKRMSTSDFTYKEFGKPAMAKKPSLDGMNMMFGMMKTIDASYKTHSVKVSGNTGVVITTTTMKATTKPGPPDNKSHKMTAVTFEKETWVKQGGSWKLRKIEETKKSTMMMDGKPFDPSQMGGG